MIGDGTSLFVLRHASDGQCPSLGLSDTLDNGGRAIASEPLEDDGPLAGDDRSDAQYQDPVLVQAA